MKEPRLNYPDPLHHFNVLSRKHTRAVKVFLLLIVILAGFYREDENPKALFYSSASQTEEITSTDCL